MDIYKIIQNVKFSVFAMHQEVSANIIDSRWTFKKYLNWLES